VSGITTQFLEWCSERLAQRGKKVWVLDNASWHISKEVRGWIKEHNGKVIKGVLEGVRIISCYLPTRSPWLNAIEHKWILMASAKWWKPKGCSASTSWPSASARPSGVHTTSIYPWPKMSLDYALVLWPRQPSQAGSQPTINPQVTYPTAPATNPVDIVSADFDLDGDLDLTTANNSGGAASVTVFVNDGAGNYSAVPLIFPLLPGANP
jgi:hypothetical protein